jgi:hypothetical protein
MNNQLTERHLTIEELTDYFSADAFADTQVPLEQHLAECDACTQLGRQVYASTLLVSRWSKVGTPAAEQILLPALMTLIERTSSSAVRERLRKWADSWSGRAEGAIRMTIETTSKASQIFTEGLADLLRPGARWQFALASVQSPVRGKSDSETISLALATGTAPARVAVSGQSGEVEIRIDSLPADLKPPLVILTSSAKGFEPRVNELNRAPGVSYWMTRFDGLEPGEYVVALEPLDLRE